MRGAIEGGLLSRDFVEAGLERILRHELTIAAPVARLFSRDRAVAITALGPASSALSVFEISSAPLMRWLGWSTAEAGPLRVAEGWWTPLVATGADAVGLLVVAWSRQPASSARAAAAHALSEGLRWAIVTNGQRLRLLDAARMASDLALEFDLDLCRADLAALSRLHVLAGPLAFRRTRSSSTLLDEARERSVAEGVRVCRSLQGGVRQALTILESTLRSARWRGSAGRPSLDDQALTAVYRVLFLLFAEARGLVPAWHPIYRDGYTVAALAARIQSGADPRGTWAALQAMARLAHSGCTAGELRVTPFNGRLFSPATAPLLDHLSLDDRAVARALEMLVFVGDTSRVRRRIAYSDLGVEQLGSVYEQLLDDRPAPGQRGPAVSARKASGTFYTPRAITDYLVRATLAPLVAARPLAGILNLRVLDPAMGSGAFLVSACRFLAAAAERASIDEGVIAEHDVDDRYRAGLRRAVAQRCLFGVDLNPTAVQLAELSLWLATLAAERPLSFLEHHVRCGDSLVGASPTDVMRRPPGVGRAGGRKDPAPLEQFFDEQEGLAQLLPARARLEETPDDSTDIVRQKERALGDLHRDPALARWRTASDVWCALFLPEWAADRPLYPSLIDQSFSRTPALAIDRAASEVAAISSAARAARWFHWPLEFPEIFLDDAGRSRPDGGFDAVVGNPPWEMLRADEGQRPARLGLAAFCRRSGLYRAQSRGHVNEYQLFLERAVSLLRPGGRLGMLVPSGLLLDSGAAPLRHLLIGQHRLESVAVFDNRRAIFPIHRGLRFAAITAVHSRRTERIQCRFGLDAPEQASRLEPQTGEGFPVTVTRHLLEALSGSDLAFPDLPTTTDAALVERLSARHRALGAQDGWCVAFGRELNATDDRDCLSASTRESSLIVIEGKHLEPFRARLDLATRRARRSIVEARLGRRAGAITRPRLAYREVASATNRTTLIAAVIPAGTVTLHTVFCCRSRLDQRSQHALCALLNSYAANYLVRRWVTTHVTAAIIGRLPVPLLSNEATVGELARLALALAGPRPSLEIEALVQALCARAYGLSEGEFAHVLETFPLVDASRRQAALDAFRDETPR